MVQVPSFAFTSKNNQGRIKRDVGQTDIADTETDIVVYCSWFKDEEDFIYHYFLTDRGRPDSDI